MPLITNCLAKRLTIKDWQGNSISSNWTRKLSSPQLYKISGDNLTSYIVDHPAYWYYSKHWTPIYLKPQTAFWIEHNIDSEHFAEDDIDLPVPHLGIYLEATAEEGSDDEFANKLIVTTFYGETKNSMVMSPCHEILTLNQEGKVVERELVGAEKDDSLLKYRTLRDSFFGIFPLTVISSQADGDHVSVVSQNARLPLKNINNKNKAKRDKAKKNSKMRYWNILIG